MIWMLTITETAILAIGGLAYTRWEAHTRELVSGTNLVQGAIVALMLVSTALTLAILDLTTPQHAALILLTFTGIVDLHHKIIPDKIIGIGFLLCFILQPAPHFLEAIAMFFGLLVVAYIYYRIRHDIPMGGGDIKLISLVALFVGWQVLGIFYTACALMVGWAAITWIISRKNFLDLYVPLAPCLAVGNSAYLLGSAFLVP